MDIIKKALSKSKNPTIAFSGGKDSTVVLDLVRKIDPTVKAVFCNTGVEFPETLEYVRTIDNLIELHPDRTFFDCVEEYGFPDLKGSNSSNRVNHCCYYLKDKPMKQLIKQEDVDLIFTGLTMDESRQRMMFLKHYGNYMYVKSWKVWKCHPISIWSVEQVWDYIKSNNLSYNSVYDKGQLRCGCRVCTAFCSWKTAMAKDNPKLLAWVLQKRFNQTVLDIN